tara:strand:- start:961 stop:1092 length:132 start_codon:yes stop_codon:yes gene_type:complete
MAKRVYHRTTALFALIKTPTMRLDRSTLLRDELAVYKTILARY